MQNDKKPHKRTKKEQQTNKKRKTKQNKENKKQTKSPNKTKNNPPTHTKQPSTRNPQIFKYSQTGEICTVAGILSKKVNFKKFRPLLRFNNLQTYSQHGLEWGVKSPWCSG